MVTEEQVRNGMLVRWILGIAAGLVLASIMAVGRLQWQANERLTMLSSDLSHISEKVGRIETTVDSLRNAALGRDRVEAMITERLAPILERLAKLEAK